MSSEQLSWQVRAMPAFQNNGDHHSFIHHSTSNIPSSPVNLLTHVTFKFKSRLLSRIIHSSAPFVASICE